MSRRLFVSLSSVAAFGAMTLPNIIAGVSWMG